MLTAHEPGSTVPLDQKRAFKIAYFLTHYRRFRHLDRHADAILEPIPLGHRQPVTEPPREPIGIGS
jgi:hypothetical protein